MFWNRYQEPRMSGISALFASPTGNRRLRWELNKHYAKAVPMPFHIAGVLAVYLQTQYPEMWTDVIELKPREEWAVVLRKGPGEWYVSAWNLASPWDGHDPKAQQTPYT